MNQIHDLLGSIIIGGIVLLMLLAFNGNIMESAGTQTFKTVVQTNLSAVTDIMENDFRKMGFRVALGVSDSVITYADSNRIKFRGDINNDGVVDTVEYYVDAVGASVTSNPNDKVLHRKENNRTPVNMYLGVINVKMYYYGANDAPITNTPIPAASLGGIRSVKISVNIQSKDRIFDNRKSQRMGNPFIDTTYAGGYWERKIKPVNTR